MYNLAIRKCTSSPLLAPRLKFFKLKFTTLPGIDLLNQRQTCYHLNQCGEQTLKVNIYIKLLYYQFHCMAVKLGLPT